MAKLIEVTAELVAEASRSDSSHCAIADAIRAAHPEYTNISVDLQSIRFSDRSAGKRYIYFTPPLCQQKLVSFDQGVIVRPWSFRLPSKPAQLWHGLPGAGSAPSLRPALLRR